LRGQQIAYLRLQRLTINGYYFRDGRSNRHDLGLL
jgi:hypothetical protein